MSDARAFCPRCGEPYGERPDRDAPRDPTGRGARICEECYLAAFDLVAAPDRIEVEVCTGCGAVRQGKRWTDVGARDYTDVAVDQVREAITVHVDADDVSWTVRPEQVDATTIRMHASVTGMVRDRPVDADVTVPVKIAGGTCERCGRIAGDDFAATVQVRARDRVPTDEELATARAIASDYVGDRERTGDRNAYITEVVETADGLDVKVSTSQIGRAIADRIVNRFGGTVDDAQRLITEDGDGNRVYRMAYAVRLPPYRPGDVIDPHDGDGPVLVRSVRGNLKGVRLRSGDPYEAAHEDGIAPEATRLGRREDAQETTLVVVEDDNAVQVLDPETYEATTIARPDYLDPEADTVPVLKSRAGVHVLPDE